MKVFWYVLPLLITLVLATDVCSNNACRNNGQCQVINGPGMNTTFSCQCPKCFTGERCEFRNDIIPLSLTSAMLTDVRVAKNVLVGNRKRIMFICIITVFVLISLINNFFSLLTFLSRSEINHHRIRTIGNNRLFLTLYCVYAIVVALELQSRAILMFYDQYSSPSYKFYSCNIAPVLSTVLIHLGVWLSTSIIIERTLYHLFFIEIINSRAKKRTVIICISMTIVVSLTHLHEIIGRRALPDPIHPNSFICSFDYEQNWLNNLDDCLSTLHLALPCCIHLVCIILELWRIDRLKYQSRYGDIPRVTIWLNELKMQRSHLIPPVLIIVCCLPHFIFAHLIHHCAEPSQDSLLHLHIALNLLVFVPQAVTFVIYVLPSEDYMEEFRTTAVGRLVTCRSCGDRQLSPRENECAALQMTATRSLNHIDLVEETNT